MTLRFYARPGFLVPVPGTQRVSGQAPFRVGRGPGLVATKESFDVDADSPVGRELSRICRQDGVSHPLWAVDEATATFVGMPFVPVAFDEESQEWIAAPAPVKTKKGE